MKNWIKKHKILTGVLAFFLLLMMTPTDDASSTDTNSDTKDSQTSENTDAKPEETKAEETKAEETKKEETKKEENSVSYNYGDVISEENAVKYRIKDGVEYSITKQNLYTKDEIAATNPYSNSDNAIAQIYVKISNNSKEKVNYNAINFSGETGTGVKVKYLDGGLTVMPDDQMSQNSLSAGDLMPGNSVEGYVAFPVSDNDYVSTLKMTGVSNSFEVTLPKM